MNQQALGPSSPRQGLTRIRIVFGAITTGLLLFLLAAVFINQWKGPLSPDLLTYDKQLTAGIAILSFICLLLAKRIFNKGITSAKDSLIPLDTKLSLYQAALIKYMAVCEFPAIAGIILFLLTGNFVFLVFAAVLLGCMLAMIPLRKRVIELLELDYQQQERLAH